MITQRVLNRIRQKKIYQKVVCPLASPLHARENTIRMRKNFLYFCLACLWYFTLSIKVVVNSIFFQLLVSDLSRGHPLILLAIFFLDSIGQSDRLICFFTWLRVFHFFSVWLWMDFFSEINLSNAWHIQNFFFCFGATLSASKYFVKINLQSNFLLVRSHR